MKILNLYGGIGGNRKLWGDEHKITTIENNKEIAKIYQDFFPNDKVIICDAHQYLLEHYKEFDFIWSSPPCQNHSSFRYNICVRFRGTKPEYPDMKLYQEIIFLQKHFKGKWVVENVKPYYKPLIEGKLIQRHMFWSNFKIGKNLKRSEIYNNNQNSSKGHIALSKSIAKTNEQPLAKGESVGSNPTSDANFSIRKAQIPDLQKKYGFDLSKFKLKNKRQVLRNCVLPKIGLHIFKMAFKDKQEVLI